MSKLEMLGPAPEVWANIINRFPIVAVTGAVYYPHPHGTPSNNIPLPVNEGMGIAEVLSKNEWPQIQTDISHPDRQGDKQIFALGSLLYFSPPYNDARPYKKIKSWTKEIVEGGKTLQDLERFGVRPLAIVMADMDCSNTEENLWKISSILSKNYKDDDLAIFDSGESFHIVFKKFVEPRHIPRCYGEIIQSFVETAPVDQRYIFEKIGQDLQKYWDQPDIVRGVCDSIIDKISHYDDPSSSGIHFMVDLRWMAHTILELLTYLDTKTGGFGYLRISDKPGCDSPPRGILSHRVDRSVTLIPKRGQKIDLGKILGS